MERRHRGSVSATGLLGAEGNEFFPRWIFPRGQLLLAICRLVSNQFFCLMERKKNILFLPVCTCRTKTLVSGTGSCEIKGAVMDSCEGCSGRWRGGGDVRSVT